MYDLVSDTFFGNSGTGTFTAGFAVADAYLPSLKEIGASAFKDCISLVSYNNDVTTDIGDYSFSGCPKLEKVVLSSTGDVTLGQHSFDSSSNDTTSGLRLTGKIVEIQGSAFKESKLCSINDSDGKIKLNDLSGEGLAEYSFEDMTGITTFVSSTLTTIKEGIFKGSSVATVTAPSVTKVYGSAFEGCVNLCDVTLAADKNCGLYDTYCFKDAGTSGTGLVVIAKITSIGGGYAFQGAKINKIGTSSGGSSGSVQMDYLDTLAEGTFLQATGMTSFTSSSLTSLAKYAFEETGLITFNAPSVTNIGERAFYDCDSLSTVTVSSATDVTIGTEAFRGSDPASGLSVTGKIKTIGDSAFRESTVNSINGSSVASVVLTDYATIGDYAFYDTDNVTGVVAPTYATIGDHAFDSCNALNYFDTSPNVDSLSHTGLLRMLNGFNIGEYAFSKTNLDRIELDGASSVSDMVIGEGAFSGINGITEVFVPEGVTEIEAYTFKDCSNLKNVYLPNTVVTVDTSAFCNTASGGQMNLYIFTADSGLTFKCTGSLKPDNLIVYSSYTNEVIKVKLQAYATAVYVNVSRASVTLKYSTSVVENRYALDGVKFKLPYILGSNNLRTATEDFGIAELSLVNQDETIDFLKVGASGGTFVTYLTKYGSGSYGTITLWDETKITDAGKTLHDTVDVKVNSYKITVDSIEYTLTVASGYQAIDGTYSYGDTVSFSPLVASPSGISKFYYTSDSSGLKYHDDKSVTTRIVFYDDTYTIELQPTPITVIWKNFDGSILKSEQSKYYEGDQISWSDSVPTRAGYKFNYWKVTSGTVRTGAETEFGGDGKVTYTVAGRQALEITAQYSALSYTFEVKNVDSSTYRTLDVTGPYTVSKNSDNTLSVQWTISGDITQTETISLPTFEFGYKFSSYICEDSVVLTSRTFYASTYVSITHTPQSYTVSYYSSYDGSQSGVDPPASITIDDEVHTVGDSLTYWFNQSKSITVTIGNADNLVYSGYRVGTSATKMSGNPLLDQSVFTSSTSASITLVFSDPSYYVWYDCDNDAQQVFKTDTNRYTVGDYVSISDYSSQITSKYGYKLVQAEWTYTYNSEERTISGYGFNFTSEMADIGLSNDYVFTLKAKWTVAKITVQYTTGTDSEGDWKDFLGDSYNGVTKLWSGTVASGSQISFNKTGICSDSIKIGEAFTPTISGVTWTGFNWTGSWEIVKKSSGSEKFSGSFTFSSAEELKLYDRDDDYEDDVYVIWVSPVFEYLKYHALYDISPATGSVTDTHDYMSGTVITLKTKDDVPDYPNYTFSAWRLSGEEMADTYTVNQDTIANANSDRQFVFIATWVETTYYVSYDLNGGKGTQVPTAGPFKQTDPYTLPSSSGYTRTGYLCAGWGIGNVVFSEAPTMISDISSNADKMGIITINLVWTPSTYTITYSLDDGFISTDAPNIGYYNSDVNIPFPTKDGYTFDGWTSTNAYSGAQYKDNGVYKPWISSECAKFECFQNLAVSNGSVELVANWTAVSYSMLFNLNGGSGTAPQTQTIKVDETMTLPSYSGYTLDGYEPKGWSANGTDTVKTGDVFTSYIAGNADDKRTVTFYLLWSPARYTVVLNEDNGGTNKEIDAYYGIQLITSTPVKSGYEFKGWLATAEFTTSNAQCSPDGFAWYGWDGTTTTECMYFKSLSNTPGSTVTLVAQWEKEKYTMMFDLAAGSGTVPTDITVKIDEAMTGLPSLDGITYTGYKALGWTIDGTSVVTSDSVFTSYHASFANSAKIVVASVKWAPNQYNLEVDDGRTVSKLTVNYGESVNVGKPLKSGYTFVGWYLGTSLVPGSLYSSDGEAWYEWDGKSTSYTYFKNLSTTASSTVQMISKWTLEDYVMVFDLSGGTGTVPTSVTTHIGESMSLPGYSAFSNVGYYAAGWTIDGSTILVNGSEFTSSLARYADDTRTVYVKLVWSPIQYTIEYSDGTHVSTADVLFNEAVNIGIPVNEGYVFAGWEASESSLSDLAKSSRDGEIWSSWDGTATSSTYFKSLCSDEGGTVQLTAQWKSDSFTIKYNANGGTGTVPVDENVYSVGDPVTLVSSSEVDLKKSGSDFAGWSYDKNASSAIEMTEFTLEYVVLTDDYNQLTLYAVWTSGNYTVTVNIGASTPSSVPSGWIDIGGGKYTKLYGYGTNTEYITKEWSNVTLTLDGFTFSGWSYGSDIVMSDMAITAEFKEVFKNGILVTIGLLAAIIIAVLALTRIERR